MSFARARLPVGEARRHPTEEYELDQWPRGEVVDELVVCRLVERVVEAKLLVLKVLGEVHLELRLVHYYVLFVGHCNHIDLLLR